MARFKFNPYRRRIALSIERDPKRFLSNTALGKFVEKPAEIPESAVRPGTYLVRYGKGHANEYEFVESIQRWFDKGRVYLEYGQNLDWITLPCLRDHEYEAMKQISYMLSPEWQRIYIAMRREREGKQIRRQSRVAARAILGKRKQVS